MLRGHFNKAGAVYEGIAGAAHALKKEDTVKGALI
jgi:hypothetical protein